MAQHPPAHRREILREFKAGEHPARLLDEARSVADEGLRALTLLQLAGDDRIPASKAGKILQETGRNLKAMDPTMRMVEVWEETLRLLDAWRPREDHQAAIEIIHERAVEAVRSMPNGTWLRDAMQSISVWLTPPMQQRLLLRAMKNQGMEADTCKAVLRSVRGEWHLFEEALSEAPPDLAANLTTYLAHKGKATPDQALQAAYNAENPQEALRLLIWNCDDADTLQTIAASAKSHGALGAHVLTTVGAREDRLTLGNPTNRFNGAADLISNLQGKERNKAINKLQTAMEKSGLAFPEWLQRDDVKEEPKQIMQLETKQAKRNTLGLVGSYSGPLGPVHVRAVARAAPLCIAFDLDLALIDFPGSFDDVITVANQSNIGEGGEYLHQLQAEQRVTWIESEEGATLPGHAVATTPHPEKQGTPQFPACLLIGLGRQGLPKKWLEAAPTHYELTGQGISLETATAMGILADRLGKFDGSAAL